MLLPPYTLESSPPFISILDVLTSPVTFEPPYVLVIIPSFIKTSLVVRFVLLPPPYTLVIFPLFTTTLTDLLGIPDTSLPPKTLAISPLLIVTSISP